MIPIISEDALAEAAIKFQKAYAKISTLDPKEADRVLNELCFESEENQPHVFEFFTETIQLLTKNDINTIPSPSLYFYVLIIIKSMYIQQEMDEVGKLYYFEEDQ